MKQSGLFILFLLTFIYSKAERDTIIYDYDCKTCPRYVVAYNGDSAIRFYRIELNGDTAYFWDYKTRIFQSNNGAYLYSFISNSEERRLQNIQRNKRGLPLLPEYEDGAIEMIGEASGSDVENHAKRTKEELIAYHEWQNKDRILEQAYNEKFYEDHKQGYQYIIEANGFKIIQSITHRGFRQGLFLKYYNDKLVCKGQFIDNKPGGIWIFYPYEFYKGFDIRWYANENEMIDEGNFSGFSFIYFLIPLILLFVILFVSVRYKKYAWYFYSLLLLAGILITIAFSKYHSKSFMIFSGIVICLIVLLSMINIALGKKSGTNLLVNILLVLMGMAFFGFIYVISHMGKIGG